MLDKLMGGFVDKVQITEEYLSDAMEGAMEQHGLKINEIAFMIRPVYKKDENKELVLDKENNPIIVPAAWIVQMEDNKPKKLIREITIKEIVDPDE
jgi:hypothetical protein